MGRGLSDLQKRILKLALTRAKTLDPGDATSRGKYPERLYNCQIFEHLYGWEPDPRAGVGSPKFKPDEIGLKAYRSAKVAVHKSCRRLESRGLVTIIEADISHWTGITLTQEGRQLAASL